MGLVGLNKMRFTSCYRTRIQVVEHKQQDFNIVVVPKSQDNKANKTDEYDGTTWTDGGNDIE